MPGKNACPTCGRTVTVLASGDVRRHKDTATGDWCEGGSVQSNVVAIGRKRGGPRESTKMTAAEKAAANERRPPSKGLDRSGHGACGAKNRDKDGTPSGTTCGMARGAGTDHLGFGRCARHGGSTPNGKKHAALERAQAEYARVKTAMTFYGQRTAVDPEQALLEEMQRTVGAVRWLEQALSEWGKFEAMAAQLAELDPAGDSAEEHSAEEHNAAQAALERLVDGIARGAVAEAVTASDPRTGLPTLVGVHSTEKALGFTDTEYAAWLKVYQNERRHLAMVAKACLDANIAERRQSVLEARADMIRSLVLISFRIAGVKETEERMLEIVAEATRAVIKEIPA